MKDAETSQTETRQGTLYFVTFTTLHGLMFPEGVDEDLYVVRFGSDEEARSWRVPGGFPLDSASPSLTRVEPAPEDWEAEWGHLTRVYTPEELVAKVRKRWGTGTLEEEGAGGDAG